MTTAGARSRRLEPPATSGAREPRRHFGAALKATLAWLANPVSAEGSAHGWRLVYSAGGPEVHRSLAATKAHPIGARILRERPDLGRALGDTAALGRMPEGSLGRRYLGFVDHSGVIPAYMVAGAAHADGALERLPWSEDAKWLVDRMASCHDLLHVLAGYGPDLAGEALLIVFQVGLADPMGIGQPLARTFGDLSGRLLRPTVGFARWRAAARDAFERGRAVRHHRAFFTNYFEELLPLPFDAVLAEIGMPHLEESASDTSRWIDGWLATRIGSGFGAMERWARRSRKSEALVAAGVPARLLLSAPRRAQQRAWQRLDDGESVESVIADLEAQCPYRGTQRTSSTRMRAATSHALASGETHRAR